MLDTFKDMIKSFFQSRILPVAVVFILLFAILVNRLFSLQIADTDTYASQAAKRTEKTKSIKAARGKIYDCNGKLLAYNKLSYNIVFAENDTTADLTSEEKNTMIYKLLKLMERENTDLTVEFYIRYNKKNELEFTLKGNSLLRFKAEVFSTTVEEMTQKQRDMSAQNIYDFLRYDTGSTSPKFAIDKKYDDGTCIQIMAIRYAMFINRYKKYQPITLATDVVIKWLPRLKKTVKSCPVLILKKIQRVYIIRVSILLICSGIPERYRQSG